MTRKKKRLENLGLNPATQGAGSETPVDLHVVGQTSLALEHLVEQKHLLHQNKMMFFYIFAHRLHKCK